MAKVTAVKSKVLRTSSHVMADAPGDRVAPQGSPGVGRVDRGGSNAGKGYKPTGSVIPNSKGYNY